MQPSRPLSGLARAAIITGLVGALSDPGPMGHRRMSYERPPGRPGIKKYRARRKVRARIAKESRRKNR